MRAVGTTAQAKQEDAIKEDKFRSDHAMLSSIMKVGNVGAFTVNLVYNELTGLTPHRQWKGGVAHYVFNSSRMHARISASVGSTVIPFDFRRSWAAACKSFLSATINAARRR